ncbi:MAG: argininosuccinate lyase [Chloroflexota bacterium]|nr:argininosuccinate lyase [Chloroflexota bacterium]
MPEEYTSLEYTASIHYDWRLYKEDIAGSTAHARMLGAQGVINPDEAKTIITGLETIRSEIGKGIFPWNQALEDIHMNIESRLFELIGETAGKLHTARSRNDQIATDMRLYVRGVADDAVVLIRKLQSALVFKAEQHVHTAMPGYTHLQRAQPIVLAHHLLAYVQMLDRDLERFDQTRTRANVLPLGSGALAGSPYPLDRESVAKELEFEGVTENSMDAVSDRDFVLDYLYAASICMAHLSRLGEEFVLWSSEEFGFLLLAEVDTTGSSIMPQKRNPDLAELARGRTGRVYGHLMGMLTVVKGIPLSYNRDLQEDKEALFDTVDTLLPTLAAVTRMVDGASFNVERMYQAVDGGGYSLATDLADYLARKGVPFRQAHGIVTELTRYAAEVEKRFDEMTLEEYRRFSPEFDEDILGTTVTSALDARDVPGGTAPSQIAGVLKRAKDRLGL